MHKRNVLAPICFLALTGDCRGDDNCHRILDSLRDQYSSSAGYAVLCKRAGPVQSDIPEADFSRYGIRLTGERLPGPMGELAPVLSESTISVSSDKVVRTSTISFLTPHDTRQSPLVELAAQTWMMYPIRPGDSTKLSRTPDRSPQEQAELRERGITPQKLNWGRASCQTLVLYALEQLEAAPDLDCTDEPDGGSFVASKKFGVAIRSSKTFEVEAVDISLPQSERLSYRFEGNLVSPLLPARHPKSLLIWQSQDGSAFLPVTAEHYTAIEKPRLDASMFSPNSVASVVEDPADAKPLTAGSAQSVETKQPAVWPWGALGAACCAGGLALAAFAYRQRRSRLTK
jgi:hypothetical protein